MSETETRLSKYAVNYETRPRTLRSGQWSVSRPRLIMTHTINIEQSSEEMPRDKTKIYVTLLLKNYFNKHITVYVVCGECVEISLRFQFLSRLALLVGFMYTVSSNSEIFRVCLMLIIFTSFSENNLFHCNLKGRKHDSSFPQLIEWF